jgi:FkbM family methyltransferase
MIRYFAHLLFHKLGYGLVKSNGSFDVQKNLINIHEPIIFDVGAHIGQTYEIYRKLFPFAYIYCFEPCPDSFKKLESTISKHSSSFGYQMAVSKSIGQANLNLNLSSATNSLLETDQRGKDYWGKGLLETVDKVVVDTINLDDFCKKNNIENINILKIDTQGHEFDVLLGAQSLLKNQKIDMIYMEMILCPTYVGQHKIHEYLAMLDEFGYEVFDFFNCGKIDGKLIQSDVLLTKSS